MNTLYTTKQYKNNQTHKDLSKVYKEVDRICVKKLRNKEHHPNFIDSMKTKKRWNQEKEVPQLLFYVEVQWREWGKGEKVP